MVVVVDFNAFVVVDVNTSVVVDVNTFVVADVNTFVVVLLFLTMLTTREDWEKSIKRCSVVNGPANQLFADVVVDVDTFVVVLLRLGEVHKAVQCSQWPC